MKGIYNHIRHKTPEGMMFHPYEEIVKDTRSQKFLEEQDEQDRGDDGCNLFDDWIWILYHRSVKLRSNVDACWLVSTANFDFFLVDFLLLYDRSNICFTDPLM